MKFLIIEDEPLMAEDLRRKLLIIDQRAEILASLPTCKAILNYFDKDTAILPDIILADIRLRDGLCFDALRKAQKH